MISRYEVYLNGQALSTISADILIRDVKYAPPAFTNSSFTVAKRQGQRIYRRHVDKSSVTVTFEIRAYDTTIRQQICNAVATWARKGGELQINDREGQRLRCICETFPVITSALRWTDPLTVVFAAYAQPFWEDVIPTTLTLSGTSGSGSLFVPGCVEDALVEAEITANAALTSVSLTAGSRTLTLGGISVASGSVIKIAYDDEMIQSIKVGNTSLLAKRTGADDLTVDCGETTALSFTSSDSASVKFSVRGLWI